MELKIVGNDDYKGAQSDGSSWQKRNCRRRVMRGGDDSKYSRRSFVAVRIG